MKKIRLDQHLAQNSLSVSREKAKSEIIAGWVKINGETVREPKKMITGQENITIQRPGGTFVSRGGEKLKSALKTFAIDVSGKVIADLGASTGGFTDCLLQAGAQKVYAVDVGYGQLDYKLRQDSRVIVYERTNVKNLRKDMFTKKVDFITADLSFISLTKVIDTITEIFSPVSGVFLLKPQFEALPGEHKKGVVRKPEIHQAIIHRTLNAVQKKGLCIRGLHYSPIKGPAGNIEFLLHFSCGEDETGRDIDIEKLTSETVARAHSELSS